MITKKLSVSNLTPIQFAVRLNMYSIYKNHTISNKSKCMHDYSIKNVMCSYYHMLQISENNNVLLNLKHNTFADYCMHTESDYVVLIDTFNLTGVC